MSVKIIVSLEVENFDHFKSVFEKGRPYREQAGISESDAYRNIDSPKSAYVIGTATSKEVFIEFFTSDAQKERMKNAGSKPAGPPIFLEG
ncbi:hypothetical protein M1N55_05960 [Dehalococcoidia bacterium]|nr:hypothetical protein [Dehalococcoidia bacterium]